MPWPVHPTGFFGARGDNDSYRIERSLRFNSADSAYLNRTFSGTPYTYTLSWWVKRGTLSTDQIMFGSRQGASNPSYVQLLSNNTISITLGVNSTVLTTTRVFRDPSAWYHFVLSVTPSATSYFYVNGIQVGSWTSSATPYLFNSAYTNAIGRYGDSASFYFDGYMAEINFIDGQALTPSSFGETDAITGRWKANAYSGTYGTNGFYLNFSDNSSLTTTSNVGIGKDFSGNGNYWATNGLSVTAGVGNDSLVDSPTNYGTDTGVGGEVRGNYATHNPIDNSGGATLSNGNLDVAISGLKSTRSTIAMRSGKWYCECLVNTVGNTMVGLLNSSASLSQHIGSNANSWGYYHNGQKYLNNSATNYGNTYTNADIIGIAYNADSGKLWFSKNGTWQASGDPVAGTNEAYSSISGDIYFGTSNGGSASSNNTSFNFGQRPFAYTAPTGFKALCTTNLPTPTIQKPSKYMDVVAYTGTGASNSISSLGFSPDLVWIKNRGTTTDHAVYDTTRGTQLQLSTNSTAAEVTSSTGLTAFGSNGFTIGTSSLVNTSGTQYAAWAWDEAPIAGMDIVGYTGNGTTQNISHSLGVAPKMIIVKSRSASSDWTVGHASLDATSPWGYYIFLSSTAARNSAGAINSWGNNSVVVPPTSSVFTIGSGGNLNASSATYIAYLFAEVEGFSKFGSYTGNGSADGPFVWCGFRPRWVMMKRIDAAGKPWCIHDTARDIQNVSNSELEANSATAENGGTYPGDLDILSNGFKPREGSSAWINESGTFIFAAFAESPFKYARAR